MRIRQLLQNESVTLADLLTAVFCAAVSQSSGGEWIIGTAVAEAATAQTLQQFEWLGLIWDDGPEPEEDATYNKTYTINNTQTIAQFDQTHGATHEILVGDVAHTNQGIVPIRFPSVQMGGLSVNDLLDGDYLPTAVWHYLLSLGCPTAREHERLTSYTVKKNFKLEQRSQYPITLQHADLLAINQRYIAHLPAETVAEKIRPYLEEWFGALPMVDQWQIDLAAIVRPQLRHYSDAPDVAGWAFADGWEYTAEAEARLQQEKYRPVFVSLVAELAHIVLLDRGTADSILAGLAERFPQETELNTTLLSALTGQENQLPLAAVMAILGKAQCLQRVGDALQS